MPAKKKVAAKATAAKKAPAKKVAAKKAPAAAKAVVKKVKPIKEAMTKTAMLNQIAEDTGLTRKEVGAVLDSLTDVIEGHIKKGGVGACSIPGLLKIKTIHKPKQPARKNVPNPFKPGEMMDVAAKPARTVVKALPLKKLKDMAS